MVTALERKHRLSLLLAGAAVLAGVLLFWQPFRQLLWQVALAALLAALCQPLQTQLEKKLPPGPAALMSVAGVGVLLIGMVVLVLPQLVSRLSELIGQIPALLSTIQNLWQRISRMEWFQALHLDSDLPQAWMKEVGNFVAAEAPKLLSSLAGGVNALSRAFLAPVLSYYLLRDRDSFAYKASLWIPAKYRKTSLKALRAMKREVGSYIRGQVAISLAVMGLTALGLILLRVPSALALGAIMGVCELIPYIGPLIGGIPIVLFSLPLGLSRTVWALILVIGVQQIEGYFLSPRLMAGAVSLHPVYVLLLLSAGGLMGGLVGMMAVIPLFVCARGALRIIYVEKQPEKIVKNVNFDRE